jgi:pyruvate,water dikinase
MSAVPDRPRFDPLRDEIDGRSLVTEHRARFEHWHTLEAPDFIGTEATGPKPLAGLNQPAATERVSADGKLHSGVAASAGVACGRARVVTELSEAMMLEPGEVLVCRTTAPPWTPVFELASTVVNESSLGIMSHSAIVAREYKIPAVLGIRNATTMIPNGAMITVDGDRGTVRLD